MSTIALIGPDGAGKTSVAQALVANSQLPLKYLYMGTSIESANVTLPTSRLVHRIKVNQVRRSMAKRGEAIPDEVDFHGEEHRVDRRGKLGAAARLVRRVSEESYRQIFSWIYQGRGHVVLYDRHFVFDVLPRPADLHAKRRLTDRIHNWFLYRLYPRPDFVILFDAPVEVLHSRTQEVTPEYLQADRERLRDRLEYAKEHVSIDASGSLDEVIARVERAIVGYLEGGGSDA